MVEKWNGHEFKPCSVVSVWFCFLVGVLLSCEYHGQDWNRQILTVLAVFAGQGRSKQGPCGARHARGWCI
jgi:hypothetical protein